MRGNWSGVALLTVVLVGCYEPAPPPPSAAPVPETTATETPTPEAATPEAATPEAATADMAAPQSPSESPSESAATEPMNQGAENATAENENVEKAQVGVGKRGRDYGGGIITEPARQRFLIADRLTFTAIDHAMNLYKATNGHLPKSHDEFMRDIIQANNLKLPDLPAGDEYFYDPERGELMVRHPQK